MLYKYLSSEKGMGFADLLGATVIVVVALSTMFLISLSSQIRVTQDYHYRKALLGALSRLETIKYYNRNFKRVLNIYTIPDIQDDIVLDNTYDPPLVASVHIFVNTKYGLLEVSPYAARYEVTIKVDWIEKSSSILNLFHPRPQSIVLREDYYFQTQQGSD